MTGKTALLSTLLVLAIAPPSFTLAMRLHAGERLVERRYENDQIEWRLPRKRLEHFKRAGVIIKEELHTTTTVRATVEAVIKDVAQLAGDVSVSSFDVPRQQATTSHQAFAAKLRTNNEPLTSDALSAEDAAMVSLPATPVHLGSRWQTKLRVLTTLGSGNVVFDHQVTSLDNGLLRISVSGKGEITGTEYHLPKLLPGTIELHGAAWYDISAGLITQESYAMHDQLLKPAEGEQIGFDERATVDVSTRKI